MIYGLIAVVVVAVVAWWLITKGLGRQYTLGDADKKRVQEAWSNIETLAQDENESAHSRAIMEADKLLDFVLKQKGIAGESLGERLKNGKDHFQNVDSAWQAHKVRNQLVHDIDIKLSFKQVRQTLDLFKKSLRELGAL